MKQDKYSTARPDAGATEVKQLNPGGPDQTLVSSDARLQFTMQIEYRKDNTDQFTAELRQVVGERGSKSQDDIKRKRKLPNKRVVIWVSLIAIAFCAVIIAVVLGATKEERKIALGDNDWGNWTSYSDCSHTCGGGTQYRVRNCDDEGFVCPGNEIEIRSCHAEPCPKPGGWGKWSLFSECSHSCGGGIQTRSRTCDNPSPDEGGTQCSGNNTETRACNSQACPVHGGWGSWSVVSGCTRSCGGGMRCRARNCDRPSPTQSGEWCPGNATELQQCNTHSCTDREQKSAFTVFNPRDGPNYGTLKFYYVVTNIGGHYNELNGQYHCSNPGSYVFSLHLYKEYGFDSAHCNIRKNATRLIHVLSDPDIKSDHGYYESSNTVTLHLSRGDIIDIGDCTTASTIAYWTSFSGYLLQTDP